MNKVDVEGKVKILGEISKKLELITNRWTNNEIDFPTGEQIRSLGSIATQFYMVDLYPNENDLNKISTKFNQSYYDLNIFLLKNFNQLDPSSYRDIFHNLTVSITSPISPSADLKAHLKKETEELRTLFIKEINQFSRVLSIEQQINLWKYIYSDNDE